MRILYVIQGVLKGGAERLCLDTAREIIKNHNHQVLIIALHKENEYPLLTKGLEIKYITDYIKLSITGKNLINIYAYEKIVNEFKPDIIHSHLYKSELVSRENIRESTSYFTHVHGDFAEFEPFTFKTVFSKKSFSNFYERKRLFKRYYKASNHFITISNNINDTLLKQLPKSWHSQVHLLPNAIDFEKFSSFCLPNNENDVIKLISVGRLYPHKNHLFLVEVVKILNETGYSTELVIAGKGPEENQIRNLSIKYRLDNKIKLLGMIENVEQIMSESHIYVHSCISEPFGLVLIEAMASGLPVVCLDGGGNRDIMDNGLNGYILPVYSSPKEFAEKIAMLFREKELYLSISRYARKYAKGYDIQEYVNKLLNIYELTFNKKNG